MTATRLTRIDGHAAPAAPANEPVTPPATGGRDDRYWIDSLKLAAKLIAFREALPPGQRAILDGIMQRAQATNQAALGDVVGYDARPPAGAGEATGPERVPTPQERLGAVLRDYFGRVETAASSG